MSTFNLVKESFASRCEICHQSDLFDPLTNHCQRCHNLVEAKPIALSLPTTRGIIIYPNDHIFHLVIEKSKYLISLLVIADISLGAIFLACNFLFLDMLSQALVEVSAITLILSFIILILVQQSEGFILRSEIFYRLHLILTKQGL